MTSKKNDQDVTVYDISMIISGPQKAGIEHVIKEALSNAGYEVLAPLRILERKK